MGEAALRPGPLGRARPERREGHQTQRHDSEQRFSAVHAQSAPQLQDGEHLHCSAAGCTSRTDSPQRHCDWLGFDMILSLGVGFDTAPLCQPERAGA